jgi:class 3 adenylate cyclase/CHASE2 domain-containing sensor protein
VKFKPVKLAPALIAGCVILIVCLLRLLHLEVFERVEQMTYDFRVRAASRFPVPVATNLGCVFISDDSIVALNDNSLGFRYGLYWPRHVYGRAYRELVAQGAKAVAFDILFREPRPDHAAVSVSNAKWPQVTEFFNLLYPGKLPITFRDDQNEEFTQLESDDYLAWQLRNGTTAVLASEQNILPLDLFATNALGIGDIAAEPDADGVLRRAKAFRDYPKWHSAFRQIEAEFAYYGVKLKNARIIPGKEIVLPRSNGEEIRIPIDANTNFNLADLGGDDLPARAFTEERVWHMGIVLAAQELKLDLAQTEVDLRHGRIVLRGTGVKRVIPVDAEGYFYINWEIPSSGKDLLTDSFESLLLQDQIRQATHVGSSSNHWAGRLVVIGSNATGNDLTDRGATPLGKHSLLVSKHWNVANSILSGRFPQRSSMAVDILIIIALGVLSAFFTWRLRILVASLLVISLIIAYALFVCFVYIQHKYWLPVVIPIGGAMFMTHVLLVTYRALFEQTERRRVKSIFSKIVSPNIVNELLDAEKLSLGGARREVTVLFADVRGFTEFTDTTQERAEAYVAEHKLTGAEMEAYFNEQARETLGTVNTYLALVADIVKKHDGTLDKYIGDCVMAFWGAPTPNGKHARDCVRAAIEAQRALGDLNRRRLEENQRREIENLVRTSTGLIPHSLLPILTLGSGINSGLATVGLMGSEAHISNYTVFGREVNLASRLESLSGRGRIVISGATHERLLVDDPELAATCVPLPAATVKGIRSAVTIFEVPWQTTGSTSSTPTAAALPNPLETSLIVKSPAP